jgi:hypothetical protein
MWVGRYAADIVNRQTAGYGRDAVVDVVVRDQLGAVVPRAYQAGRCNGSMAQRESPRESQEGRRIHSERLSLRSSECGCRAASEA